jgi:hypothetical protein
VGCAKEVNNLIKHQVVSLLGTRMGGTSAEVVGVPVANLISQKKGEKEKGKKLKT